MAILKLKKIATFQRVFRQHTQEGIAASVN